MIPKRSMECNDNLLPRADYYQVWQIAIHQSHRAESLNCIWC